MTRPHWVAIRPDESERKYTVEMHDDQPDADTMRALVGGMFEVIDGVGAGGRTWVVFNPVADRLLNTAASYLVDKPIYGVAAVTGADFGPLPPFLADAIYRAES